VLRRKVIGERAAIIGIATKFEMAEGDVEVGEVGIEPGGASQRALRGACRLGADFGGVEVQPEGMTLIRQMAARSWRFMNGMG